MPSLPSAGDLARWAFYVRARAWLEPTHPRMFHAAHRLGVLTALRRGAPRALLADEYARCGLPDVVSEAWAAQYRVALDELPLGRHTRETLPAFLRFEGLAHLDAALDAGRGVVWTYPHAGAVMLMLAGLVQRGHRVVQVAARGLAPAEVAGAHPELLGHNPWREAVRAAREDDEDRTGAAFLDLRGSPRPLYRALADNRVVSLAFDGRIGARWEPVPFLGRTALLTPGAFKLAESTGAAVVPAFVEPCETGPHVCHVGPAVTGTVAHTRAHVLAWAEAHIRRAPASYGAWLLHCRLRNAVDDHPMFTDHARDARWRRWAAQHAGVARETPPSGDASPPPTG